MNFTERELHEALLQHLIKRRIFFSPRRINRSQKLSEGYWFLHSQDNYISVSFWNGHDQDRKIHNINLGYSFGNDQNVYLELTARRDEEKIEVLREIADQIGARLGNQRNQWFKVYAESVTTIADYLQVIDDFIATDKALIDNVIDSLDHSPISRIDNVMFQGWINNINRFRRERDQHTVDAVQHIFKSKKTLSYRCKATNRKSVDTYIRQAVQLDMHEIRQLHNELQNQLADRLKSQHGEKAVALEKDYIDVTVTTSKEIILIELKPYDDVIRCVREGLGQVLFYLHKFEQPRHKRVRIVVAGPQSPNDEERAFVEFVKQSLGVEFGYLSMN